MNPMKLTINDHEWHRNGVGGAPFYSIAFTLTEDGRDNELVAITRAIGDYETDVISEWMVIDPDELHSNWRGDRIAHTLKPMMDARLQDEREHPDRY